MAKHGDVAKGPGWELRCGDFRDVLADVTECDAVISDPPYSPRQGEEFRSHNDYARKDGARSGAGCNGSITFVQGMPYAPLTKEVAVAAVRMWARSAWFVAFGDYISFRVWEAAAEAAGRYCFAPVVWLRGNSPRFQGDGPCSAAEYICVSRPRRKTTCGSLPGWHGHPLDLAEFQSRQFIETLLFHTETARDKLIAEGGDQGTIDELEAQAQYARRLLLTERIDRDRN